MVAGGSAETGDNVEALQAEVQSLNVYIEELHAYLDRQGLLLGKFSKPPTSFFEAGRPFPNHKQQRCHNPFARRCLAVRVAQVDSRMPFGER